ncbi:hypothetical protein TCAL_06663 [Tigriopus californicus]|uniref:Centromere protein L n=1 Tax=Tigriopus californicus TaxID=6832 RepID=A0A553N7A3_TIGCA|nr:uncharacterized protein LOC131885464 [Tigriopus californicus]TRY61322.1 hypothetical protein TCAL_06663 [Tigriopus californicus]
MSHISQFEADQLRAQQRGWTIDDWEQCERALPDLKEPTPGIGGVPTPGTRRWARASYHFELKTPSRQARFRGRAKQPYSRRISFHPDLPVDLEDEAHQAATQHVCHRSWRVFHVSPLFDFHYDEASLSKWTVSLEKDLWSCFGLKGQGDWKRLKVSVKALPGLRGSSDDDQALQIKAHTHRGQKEAFKIFLLSVDRQEKLELNDNSKATRLPVMLTSGTDELIRIFRRSLEKHYHCVTGIAVFTQAELKWMSALWIDLKPEGDELKKRPMSLRKSSRNKHGKDFEPNDEEPAAEDEREEEEEEEEEEENNQEKGKIIVNPKVNLTFTLHEESKNSGIKKFVLKLQQSHLVDLWRSIHDDTEYFATMIEVQVFHQALMEKIQIELGVDFTKLKLSRIELPVVTVDSNSRVTIRSAPHVKTILRLFTELCQMNITSHCPRIGIPTDESFMM